MGRRGWGPGGEVRSGDRCDVSRSAVDGRPYVATAYVMREVTRRRATVGPGTTPRPRLEARIINLKNAALLSLKFI